MHQDTSDSNLLTVSEHDKSLRPTLNIWFCIHTVHRPNSLNQHNYLSYNTCSCCKQFSVCRKLVQKVMRPAFSWYILLARALVFVTVRIPTSQCMIRVSNFDRDALVPRAPTCSRALITSRFLAVSVKLTTFFVVVLRLIMRGVIPPL